MSTGSGDDLNRALDRARAWLVQYDKRHADPTDPPSLVALEELTATLLRKTYGSELRPQPKLTLIRGGRDDAR